MCLRQSSAAMCRPPQTNHESEFRFIVGRFGYFWQNDVVAGANHRSREFIEDCRDIGNRRVGFSRVIAIVQANADKLARAWDGRAQLHGVELVRVFTTGNGGEGLSFGQARRRRLQ